MNRDFNQIFVSESLAHFKNGMQTKWNLVDYFDPKLPAVFFGVYNDNDLEKIKKHQSYGVIIFGGNDLNEENALKVFNKKNKNRFFTFGYAWYVDFFKKYNIDHKQMILPFKNFNSLTPTKLGKNIYIYIGQPNNRRHEYFKFDDVIIPLIEIFGPKRVIWVKENMPISFELLVENYYNNSFVFVKPNVRGGSTTMWELAHMGRKTISRNQGDAPNVIEYKDLDHMIDLIYEESEKIGTIQDNVYQNIKNIFQESDEWLSLKFWL